MGVDPRVWRADCEVILRFSTAQPWCCSGVKCNNFGLGQCVVFIVYCVNITGEPGGINSYTSYIKFVSSGANNCTVFSLATSLCCCH